MEYALIKTEYESKKQKLQEEINNFVEHAINYDELIDIYETKENIDLAELEWNNAQDQRQFDNLQNCVWLVERVIDTIDEVTSIDGDRKKAHNTKKGIEMLISSARRLKKESTDFIEQEQKFLIETNSVLELLDAIRGK